MVTFWNRCSKFSKSSSLVRSYCSHLPVKVRFAPSPTGFLHLGSIRTAFYNFLFAKKTSGSFLLRIEDTDQTRMVPSSLNSIIETLSWLGLHYVGEPYIQSHHRVLHSNKAHELVKNGLAYQCFCSEERLEILRKDAARTRSKPGYDGRCTHLSQQQIDEKLSQGIPFTVRFKLVNKPIQFDDIIYGSQKFNLHESETDPIILKSDGFPTYHLANVVDDHEMSITHVFRGVEWLSSTPKHIQLYEAFGWNPPKYGHLPLLLNKDGSKLSKREDSIRIEELRKSGILPEAIFNYLRQIGSGFNNALESSSIYSLDKLAELFDIKSVLTNSCKLDRDLLYSMNKLALAQRISDQTNQTIVQLRSLINSRFGKEIGHKFDDNYLQYILEWSKTRITTLNDLTENYEFIWNEPKPTWDTDKHRLLGNLESRLLEIAILFEVQTMKDFNAVSLLRNYCNEHKVPFNKLMHLLRSATTNKSDGPPIGDIIAILGLTRFTHRLRNAACYAANH